MESAATTSPAQARHLLRHRLRSGPSAVAVALVGAACLGACTGRTSTTPSSASGQHGPSSAQPAEPVTSTTTAIAPSSALPLPTSLAGTEWARLPTTRPLVALTFDAGSNDAAVAPVLAALQAAGARATFFLTGRFAESYPQAARQIAARYPIGNHSYSHPDLTRLADAAVIDEISRATQAIERITGRDPRPLFRFPYGARNHHLISLANQLGFGDIYWTADTLGWEGTSAGQTAQSVLGRVLAHLQPGEIVLMHLGSAPDGSTLDADALPAVIQDVQARGYQFVTLDDFMATVGGPADRSS